jgi:hypothetical protein
MLRIAPMISPMSLSVASLFWICSRLLMDFAPA